MECLLPPSNIVPIPESFSVSRETLSAEEYLPLYQKIGGPVGWDLRLKLSMQELSTILTSKESRCFVLRQANEAAGFCEVNLASTGDTELLHFGLVPKFLGQGLSLPFLQLILRRVFAEGAKRIWLHTDEQDSPAAQKVYSKAGFSVYDSKFMDPTPL